MSRLLCFADAHIGSGAGIPGRLADHETILERIFDVARARDVEGILFAGDLFHGPQITPEQLDTFMRPFEDLNGEIPLLAISGNSVHDLAMRGVNALAPLRHLPGITICSQPGVQSFAGCSVACLPWVHPGRLIARAGRDVPRDEINTISADLLLDVARDLYAACIRPAILMLHWSVSGTALPTGLPVDDLREPVIPAEALDAIGFDWIVAGHIHVRQEIGADGFYCGPPMPLSFGEQAGEHGVTLIDTDAGTSEFVPIDSPRFVTAGLSIDDTHGASLDCDDDVADAIVRVRFTATSEQMRRVDVAAIRASLIEAGARVVKVEPQIVREQRARVAGVSAEVGVLDALDQWLDSTGYQGDRELLRSRAAMYLETVT